MQSCALEIDDVDEGAVRMQFWVINIRYVTFVCITDVPMQRDARGMILCGHPGRSQAKWRDLGASHPRIARTRAS
jgi:hypothetical protein